MVNQISRDLIRQYLDELNISTRIDSDGDLFTTLSADDDFDHDVQVYFRVSDNWLRVFGIAPEYAVSREDKGTVLFSLNKMNLERAQITGVLNNEQIVFKWACLLDEAVSEAYIKENCLKLPLSLIWHCFVDFQNL